MQNRYSPEYIRLRSVNLMSIAKALDITVKVIIDIENQPGVLMREEKRSNKTEKEKGGIKDELAGLLQSGQLAYTRKSFKEAKRLLSRGRKLAEGAGLKEDAAIFTGAILILDKETQILETLKKLLHQARCAWSRKEYGEAKRLFSEGKRTAHQAGWEEDGAVFEASILIAESRYAEAAAELEPVVTSHRISLLGYAYDLLGEAYMGKEEYQQAVNAFQSAFDDPDYDSSGRTWSNMGRLYFKRNEFDKAIRCFQEALDTPDYDAPGLAYNAMGKAYLEKNSIEQALKCFRIALDAKDNYDRGDTWDGMGLAYFKAGKYDKAIECYREALAVVDYDTPGYAWFNMGIAYMRKEELSQASAYLEKAHKWYAEAEPARLERVEYFLKELKQMQSLRRKPGKKPEQKKAAKETEDPITDIMEILARNRRKVAEYAVMPGTGYKDVLAVLKGWSSFVPVELYLDYDRFGKQFHRGGGYFIKAGERGVIVDPGLDFLMNFASQGFHIKEVKHVLVSRDHIEHSANLTSIVNLENQWLLYDQPTRKKGRITYHLNPACHKTYLPVLADMSVGSKYERKIEPNQLSYFLDGSVELDVFPARFCPEPDTFGFVMNLRLEDGEKRRIGYISETDFFEDIPVKLRGCDVIMAHFSVSPSKAVKVSEANGECASAELERVLRETTGSDIITAHFTSLGTSVQRPAPYTGLERLIDETDAKLYIVSKFWANTGDYRTEFVNKLTYDFANRGRKVNILPGDVGCMVNLTDLSIRCSKCGAFVPFAEITVTKPEGDFGKLAYFCKGCMG
ncbi:tetratricopeptide repeat protein [candidate division WOR-3 bacterium]|uniref:Tetratricopeptide repeat protein n=1 Tax=candidate division WOR-3 bacterium TaxID=2052148 RepID=A0A9D5QDM8_UNCW3|nr:tetratricopeptide repeat protein [candidate division WOR-3 bacterium]MBD3365216.1 tetratricopeptide repeat protein [candidate division WOR-3 bacterium]